MKRSFDYLSGEENAAFFVDACDCQNITAEIFHRCIRIANQLKLSPSPTYPIDVCNDISGEHCNTAFVPYSLPKTKETDGKDIVYQLEEDINKKLRLLTHLDKIKGRLT